MRVVKAMALLVLLITTLTTSTEVWDIRLVQALEERLFYRVSLFTIMGDCTRCKMDTGSWNEISISTTSGMLKTFCRASDSSIFLLSANNMTGTAGSCRRMLGGEAPKLS